MTIHGVITQINDIYRLVEQAKGRLKETTELLNKIYSKLEDIPGDASDLDIDDRGNEP